MIIFDVQIYGFRYLEADLDQSEACLVHSVRSDGLFVFFSQNDKKNDHVDNN